MRWGDTVPVVWTDVEHKTQKKNGSISCVVHDIKSAMVSGLVYTNVLTPSSSSSWHLDRMVLEREWRALSCAWEPFLFISLSCAAQSQSLPFAWAETINRSSFKTENTLLVAVLHILKGVTWQQTTTFFRIHPTLWRCYEPATASPPPYKREVKQKINK